MEQTFIQTDPGDEQEFVDKGMNKSTQLLILEPKVVLINRSPDIDEE